MSNNRRIKVIDFDKNSPTKNIESKDIMNFPDGVKVIKHDAEKLTPQQHKIILNIIKEFKGKL